MKGFLDALRNRFGVVMAISDEDWDRLPRTHVTIRRDRVVKDALREARKPRFDPAKLLKVSSCTYQRVVTSELHVGQATPIENNCICCIRSTLLERRQLILGAQAGNFGGSLFRELPILTV